MNMYDNKLMVSFIIPLYKGKRYILSIMDMLDLVQRESGETIEIVFVNDYPQEEINIQDCTISNDRINTVLIRNEDNFGIHRARVNGLSACSGDYIVMLDQDDIISSSYVKSQLNAIGCADAVICNAMHFNRKLYLNEEDQKRVLDNNTYFFYNPIASPGQVMIKRKSIPPEWTNNYLKYNGADDYYLWILMISKKKDFSINTDVLYFHHITGENYSYNVECMEKSIAEMSDKLERIGIWTQDQCMKKKHSLITEDRTRMAHDSLNIMIVKEWLYLKQSRRTIVDYFIDRSIKSIAVYGYGVLGGLLEMELVNEKVKIEYFIDSHAPQMTTIPVINPVELKKETLKVDAIVVSVAYDFDKIKRMIREHISDIRIISLLEILGNCVIDLTNNRYVRKGND